MSLQNEINLKDLYENAYCDSWQFYVNVLKNLQTANYCKKVISYLVSKLEDSNSEYHDSIQRTLEETGSYAFKNNDLDFSLKVFDIETDIYFLLDKYLKDFIQYNRNSFDSLAQFVNKTVLALKQLDVERVDFSKVLRNLDSSTDIYKKMNEIKESNEFKYLTEFNNKIKHISDAKFAIKMSLFEKGIIGEIGSFKKRGEQFEVKDIKDLVSTLEKYVEEKIDEIIGLVNDFISTTSLEAYRYHKIKVTGQIITDDPDNTFLNVYIESEDMSTMPEQIEFLFCRNDDKFDSMNFPYDEVFVRDSEGFYLGKYKANESYEDRKDIKLYRKFTKVNFREIKQFIFKSERLCEVRNVYPFYMSGDYIKA